MSMQMPVLTALWINLPSEMSQLLGYSHPPINLHHNQLQTMEAFY